MKIVVAAADRQWAELTSGPQEINWIRVADPNLFLDHPDASAFFNLINTNVSAGLARLQKPVFINAVSITLKELNAPTCVLRFNGWTGFIQRPSWELAGIIDENVRTVFARLNKTIIAVADEPGLVAARIISMIINEAFFTIGDGVSSRDEIDIAMKLGTNYPFGPFQWVDSIGPKNLVELLQNLMLHDKRYQPAPLLLIEAENII